MRLLLVVVLGLGLFAGLAAPAAASHPAPPGECPGPVARIPCTMVRCVLSSHGLDAFECFRRA